MSNVINKITGQCLESIHTPNFEGNDDWIINPTPEQIEQYQPVATLEQAQASKITAVDGKTMQLIYNGFDYNGTDFSLSSYAQANWNSLRIDIMEENNPNERFPVYVTTMDDDEYTIEDYNAFKAIYKKGMKTKKDHIDDGRGLKLQVKQADTVEEVTAIEDNRT